MKFICFGSGSSGNCYYLESRGTAILIDLGIGIRAFKRYMSNYGLTIPKIAAIIVTRPHQGGGTDGYYLSHACLCVTACA